MCSLAQAILTTKYSHTIAFYKESSRESQYAPLSDSSLWRILHAINPSQRKSLAGLDDTTAAGMNGIATLENIASKYNEKAIEASLERSKRYMKTRYQVHCSDTGDSIVSHCANFALSDSSEKHLHGEFVLSDEICADCYELCKTFEKVRDLAKLNSADGDTLYDIDIAIKDIYTIT